jgi:exopolysaccharide biosynthesis polyprenyl glycosylphosphotransferase
VVSIPTIAESAATKRADPARDWRVSYARRLALTDVLSVAWAIIGAQLIWFGVDVARVDGGRLATIAQNYTVVSIVLSLLWILALKYAGTRDSRVIGTEATEYRRVLVASLSVFGVMVSVAYLTNVEISRGYLITALPLGVLVLFASRWMWRQWLKVQRARGAFSYKLILVGSSSSALHLKTQLRRNPAAGYHVVGVVIPGEDARLVMADSDVPVWTNIDDVLRAMDATGADTVAITSSDQLPPARVRELSWSLESGRRHLIVAPSLTDIAGPRIHTRPVAGLPLIHVETPRFEGSKVYAKRAFDFVVSGALLLVLLPLLVVIALLVKASSPGPLFYRQERIGLNGAPFGIYKFRSMKPNADQELAALLAKQGDGVTPLFKIENDPRITPIGRILRKYSLDELPQLLNVFLGDMSLVGPRPQIAKEVELYDSAARRRLLLKPGMSGLWQVSGRSSLGWEDAIRLDLYYVENWSIMGDLSILWRTGKAVVAPGEDAH